MCVHGAPLSTRRRRHLRWPTRVVAQPRQRASSKLMQAIPREASLSLADFFLRYADQQRPVILTDQSPVFINVTLERIIASCGNIEVPTARRIDSDDLWAGVEDAGHFLLRDIMRDVQNGNATADGSLGVFDWPLRANCPRLLQQHYTVPKYIAQDFMQRVPRSMKLHYRDSWPSLFVGYAGSFSRLHKDVFGSAFWQYVVEGEKEWHVIDSALGVDLFAGGAARRTHALTHWHGVVRPGELIYIPGNAEHQVRNGDGPTIALAGNFVTRGSMHTMKAELQRHRNDCKSALPTHYQELADLLLDARFNTTIDTAMGDLPWEQFIDQSDAFPSGWPTATNAPTEHSELLPWSGLVVQHAGSAEVNGVYTFNAMEYDAPTYKLERDGRYFELFRVGSGGVGSEWWNIAEFEASGGWRTWYGATQADAAMQTSPPLVGWANWKLDSWRGVEPPPSLEGIKNDGSTPLPEIVHVVDRDEL